MQACLEHSAGSSAHLHAAAVLDAAVRAGAAPEGEAPPEPQSGGSSAQSVPDYVGEDLTRALSTPERMRPDHAWSLDVHASSAAPPVAPPACSRRNVNCGDASISSNSINRNRVNIIAIANENCSHHSDVYLTTSPLPRFGN